MYNLEKDYNSNDSSVENTDNMGYEGRESTIPEDFIDKKEFNSKKDERICVLCFPRTKIENVEMYLRMRYIDSYDTYFSLEEFVEDLQENDRVRVYLFDFIGEVYWSRVYSDIKQHITDLTVITDKRTVAEFNKDLTDKVFLVEQLMDIMTLFWDSKAFALNNVKNAEEDGIELINKKALEIRGTDIDQLQLSISLEKEKTSKFDEDIKYINISTKVKGTEYGKLPAKNPFKKFINGIADSLKTNYEEDYDIETGEHDTSSIMGIVNKIDNGKLDSFIDFMYNKSIFSETIRETLISLRESRQLTGIFGEVNYLVEIGALSEDESIDLVNEYHKMACLYYEDVMNTQILLSDFRVEGCLEFKCFPIKGMRRDKVYFVIDPDNVYGKDKIQDMYNNFGLVYTKEKYIIEKLKELEVR